LILINTLYFIIIIHNLNLNKALLTKSKLTKTMLNTKSQLHSQSKNKVKLENFDVSIPWGEAIAQ